MFAAEDVADYELKTCYEAWGFDHKVVVRDPTRPRLPHGGMPLLSRAGLTDLMAVESAREPERASRGLNAVLRYYSLWPAMGPLPRHALPREPPPSVLQRQEHATARYLRVAQERVDAARVEASIRAQGRQVSLSLPSCPTDIYIGTSLFVIHASVDRLTACTLIDRDRNYFSIHLLLLLVRNGLLLEICTVYCRQVPSKR